MTDRKFKVGDRVRIGPENGGYPVSKYDGLFPGNTGVVSQAYKSGVYAVRLDNSEMPTDGGGEGWSFYPDEIELVASVDPLTLQMQFETAARPLIKWLCENRHPHHSVIVTPTGAELLEGVVSTGEVLDYVKD